LHHIAAVFHLLARDAHEMRMVLDQQRQSQRAGMRLPADIVAAIGQDRVQQAARHGAAIDQDCF